MKLPENVVDTPKTTITGSILGFGGIVLSVLPPEVRDACFTSVNDSSNPILVSSLVSLGLILTIIGPSLAARKKAN